MAHPEFSKLGLIAVGCFVLPFSVLLGFGIPIWLFHRFVVGC